MLAPNHEQFWPASILGMLQICGIRMSPVWIELCMFSVVHACALVFFWGGSVCKEEM